MRIVYIHTGSSSFVNSDLAIFREVGTSSEFAFSIDKKWMTPFVFIKQMFFLLRTFPKAQLYICQFAGYHSFLPLLFSKLTGKKCLIISGGTDCVSFPGIGYGNFYKSLLSVFTKWSFKLASHLSPKHESLLKHQYTYDTSEPKEQGIYAFLPELNKQTTVIYNGYDAEKWKPVNGLRKKRSFITLCGGWQFSFQEQLKGIDLILETAPYFPDCTFTIAGVPDWKKLNIQSENVLVLRPVNNQDLPQVFSQYEYYLQLSMAEGFPNALCEAMLCECIPVVSNVFSMPEIISDSGYILMRRDCNELKILIRQILNEENSEKGKKARVLISENYPVTLRKARLKNLIESLLKE